MNLRLIHLARQTFKQKFFFSIILYLLNQLITMSSRYAELILFTSSFMNEL